MRSKAVNKFMNEIIGRMKRKLEMQKNTNNSEEYLVDTQLAENADVPEDDLDYKNDKKAYEKKRKLLKKTKIVRQTWSISEIYQKIKKESLFLDPEYQRRKIWKEDKQTSFIESLYMGIIVPPIYVVEIASHDILKPNTYEVVDGKQRLTAIMEFIDGKLKLAERSLEYYTDWFAGKVFEQIRETYNEETNEMLSSVLDIYVITSNSPEFTKYDIFSRLNKGAEKLKVNEIRKAIYRSDMLKYIEEYVDNKIKHDENYKKIFSENAIKRYDDFGRFFRSIAFCEKSSFTEHKVLEYNSRPREMINNVLSNVQNNVISMQKENLKKILDATIELELLLSNIDNKEVLIDAIIPYYVNSYDVKESLRKIVNDDIIQRTLNKSVTTTKNVNDRFKRVGEILGCVNNDI